VTYDYSVLDCPRRRRGRRPATEPEVPGDDEVLRRGVEAFAELGYAGASVRELARRLGVSHNFVNDRYGSKLAFWQAAVRSELDPIREHLEHVVATEATDTDRLTTFVRDFYRFAARHPHGNRLMTDECTRDSERLDFLHTTFIGPTTATLTPVLERLATAGQIAPLPIHLLFLAITGPAISLTQEPLAQRLGRPAQSTEEVTAAADALATVVLTGLVTATSGPST
jgi:TetR/AcrR family transcriptional regulator